jgi:undecaprenyl-diphosphatase
MAYSLPKELWRDVTSLGSAPAWLLFCLLAILHSEKLFIKLVVAGALCLLLTALIRALYFRKRPKTRPQHGFFSRLDASSFPSLHTARILALAIVVLDALFSLPVLILSLAVVLLVAYSRILLSHHDFFDLIGGIAVGAFCGWLAILL